jgi:hypothetical protein
LDIHVYWNILTMHGPINVKSPNNISKWQMGFNSAFKGLKQTHFHLISTLRMSGTITPLPLLLLWHGQGQIWFLHVH